MRVPAARINTHAFSLVYTLEGSYVHKPRLQNTWLDCHNRGRRPKFRPSPFPLGRLSVPVSLAAHCKIGTRCSTWSCKASKSSCTRWELRQLEGQLWIPLGMSREALPWNRPSWWWTRQLFWWESFTITNGATAGTDFAGGPSEPASICAGTPPRQIKKPKRSDLNQEF